MNLRHLRYFAALARERHHGRAAEACHVSQSTLSEAIRQMEAEFGAPLVTRSNGRFQGLTETGRHVLGFAHHVLTEQDTLTQQLATLHQDLTGDLRIGVIPAAMPVTPFITTAFHRRHAGVTTKVLSLTSIEIQLGLDSGDLDAGLTYLDNEPLKNVRSIPCYREHYILLTPAARSTGLATPKQPVRWKDAVDLPLCLLTPDMQNRRIIDAIFDRIGAGRPRVAVETNSVLGLLVHVAAGEWSSIVPHTFLRLLGQAGAGFGGVAAATLIEPQASHSVGLVVADREPASPLASALIKVLQSLDFSGAAAHSPSP